MLVGETAIGLELTSITDSVILNAGQSDTLFATLSAMLSHGLAYIILVILVTLLLTYLVKLADGVVLTATTINATGNGSPKARTNILF